MKIITLKHEGHKAKHINHHLFTKDSSYESLVFLRCSLPRGFSINLNRLFENGWVDVPVPYHSPYAGVLVRKK